MGDAAQRLVTVRPDQQHRKPVPRFKGIEGYSATFSRRGDEIDLVCKSRRWRASIDKTGERTGTAIDDKSLWFTANIETKLIVQSTDTSRSDTEAIEVVGVVEDYHTLRCVHVDGDHVEGDVVVFRVKQKGAR